MFFFRNKKIKCIQRNFQPAYLSDASAQKEFEQNGYTILRNVLNEEEIKEAFEQHKAICKMEGYAVNKMFESSGNFKSMELQQTVFNFVHHFMLKTAARYANLEHCEIGKGGAFFIKPNSIESKLDPHQDSPVIDETKTYAIFTWMALQDVTENEGVLYVLPKSHLWGNTYRSQHIPWAFRNSIKELWKYMIPLPVNKGDIILFDPSIIHGSGVNTSESYRLTLCGALLPKGHQKVEYLLNNGKVEQYFIDESYWLDGGNAKTLNKYRLEIKEDTFPNPIKNESIQLLLN